ncbi:MAG: hypothetical protein R3B82_17295 [Sandaracinaceae bacterium]
MSPRAPALAALVLLAAGCDTTKLASSCGGEPVDLCGPREWAEVTDARLEPSGLTIADFSMRAQIRVTLDRCGDAPAPHAVDLTALVPDGDAGSGVEVMSLLTLVDGEDGDPVAGDGVIDVDVANPFIATVPAESDLILRFVARSTTLGGCTSGSFEQPYRTGPPRP